MVRQTLKKTVAIAALGWFVAGGVGAVMAFGATKIEPTVSVSVDRASKADRLSVVAKSKLDVKGPLSAMVTRMSPPLGCDPAFSKIAEPSRPQIFRRCAV